MADKVLVNNLFENLPTELTEELFEILLNKPNIRIERIVSDGHASKQDQWYDQDDNEWVLLLQGEAQIQLFPDNNIVTLVEGSYLNIPAHTKHRVKWTTKQTKTIWLAIHY